MTEIEKAANALNKLLDERGIRNTSIVVTNCKIIISGKVNSYYHKQIIISLATSQKFPFETSVH